MDHISPFPGELISEVLGHLDRTRDRGAAACVCRQWRAIVAEQNRQARDQLPQLRSTALLLSQNGLMVRRIDPDREVAPHVLVRRQNAAIDGAIFPRLREFSRLGQTEDWIQACSSDSAAFRRLLLNFLENIGIEQPLAPVTVTSMPSGEFQAIWQSREDTHTQLFDAEGNRVGREGQLSELAEANGYLNR